MSNRHHPQTFPEDTFRALTQYTSDTFVNELSSQQLISQRALEQNFPPISLYPIEGWLMYMLATISRVKTAVEIGTLAGYSASWLARALPDDGKFYTFEIDPHHAKLAQANLNEAGFGDKVQVVVGDALTSLAQITEPIELLFIDADKTQYPAYLDWAVENLPSGALILAHNAFAQGDIINNPITLDEIRRNYVESLQLFNQRIAENDRLTAMIMPLGDGLMCAVVN